MKDYKLVNIVAHHESGHAVLGHLFGHLIAEINVNFDIEKKIPAYTLKQYGQDTTINNALEKNLPNTLTGIPINEIELSAKKYCTSLLGGPIAEEFCRHGIENVKSLQIQNTPDFKMCFQAINILQNINRSKNYSSFLTDCIDLADVALKDKRVWNTVNLLSEEILNSKELTLTQKTIYVLFEKGGLNDYKTNKGK